MNQSLPDLKEDILHKKQGIWAAHGWGVTPNYDKIFEVNKLIKLYNSRLKWYNRKLKTV